MGDTILGNVTLGDGTNGFIHDNTCRKEGVLTILPLYGFDSEDTDVFDFGGVIKIITLVGSYTAEDLGSCKAFIDAVEIFIQGHQDDKAPFPGPYPLTLVDDLRGTIKVKVMEFESTMIEGDPTRITWTIKLAHSSETS